MRELQSSLALLWLVMSPMFAGTDGRQGCEVAVVASEAVEAHRAAIEGIHAALAPSSCEVRVVDVGQGGGDGAGKALGAPAVRVIIAIGSDATRLVESERLAVPAVYAMVLRRRPEWDGKGAKGTVIIQLEVSLPGLVARMKALFPGKTRLGVILNPRWGGMNRAELEAQGQALGFAVRVVECDGAANLAPALASLRNQVDFVWCLPDGTLYNNATVKPLILASLEYRLPLIGFSESFARAGAAIGIYPDFRDVGMQAGEAARQILEGQMVPGPEGPRRLKIAVNQSVLRLLGLRCAAAGAEGGEVSILP